MTLSSASTNKPILKPRPFAAGLTLLAGFMLLGGGCAARHTAPTPRTVYGYADLTTLAQHQPAWGGLAQYDAALNRLNAAAKNLPVTGQGPKPATLPALTSAPAVSAAPAAASQARAARHLRQVQAALIGSLTARRSAARQDQIGRQQDVWQREARRLFPVPARTPEITTDLTLQLLQANVEVLTRTLDHWDNSTPPTPRLDALKQKVLADRNRLEALIAARVQARETARAARLAEIQRQRQARLDYVQAQGSALAAHLAADDERVVNAQKQRLSAQRQTLLDALARPEPASVPAAGDAGVLALPAPGAARATLSAASLDAARATLKAQRGRWVQYVTDDTQAAARDIAAARHWNVTFGPPRPGDRNLTADLERALAQG